MNLIEDSLVGSQNKFYICSQTGFIYEICESLEIISERFPEVKIPLIRANFTTFRLEISLLGACKIYFRLFKLPTCPKSF
jgi:hypothetical protein